MARTTAHQGLVSLADGNSKEAGFGQLLQLPDDGVAALASNKAARGGFGDKFPSVDLQYNSGVARNVSPTM
jgi:hypothetical protein